MDGYLRSEVLRYAGMGQADEKEIDPRIIEFADWAVEELDRQCEPRFTSKIFSLRALPKVENGLCFGGVLDVTSRSLSIHLADCEEVLFFGATLGVEADRLIRIPMCGNVESLNVGIASAILMYEAGRQRRREKRSII